MSYNEYSGNVVSGPTCSYTTLNNYNRGQNYVPIPENTPSQAVQVVPAWTPINYNALTHGTGYACGGYFQIGNAYPDARNGDCNQKFVQRPCTGFQN